MFFIILYKTWKKSEKYIFQNLLKTMLRTPKNMFNPQRPTGRSSKVIFSVFYVKNLNLRYIFFSFLIILKCSNLEICEHSSFFLIIDEIVFLIKFNLKIGKLALIIKPIEQLRFLNISN